MQQFRRLVGLARDAKEVLEQALGHQRQAEGQQQTVQMVELVQALEHAALDHDRQRADQQRRQHQRQPVVDAQVVQSEPGTEGAEHVLGAMGEVDDVEQAEDDGQSQAQHGIEGAVDQAQQQLAEKGLRRDAEDFHGL